MKLTLIETGLPPESLRADWPRYPAMFETLISDVDNRFSYETVSLITGQTLPNPADLKGIIITGSAYGVYEDIEWMPTLMDFIRGAAKADIPQFGICFGHQAMAKALGGKVIKSDKGWGIGRHVYETPTRPAWMQTGPQTFAIAVSHQDQVVAIPADAQVTARSEFCEYAGIAYSGGKAASFQGHPEFGADFSSALHILRRERIGDQLVEEAIASFTEPLDSKCVARWMADFFHSAAYLPG